MASSSLEAPPGVTRPVVFFDISIGETPAGRVKMGASSVLLVLFACSLVSELFSDITPKYLSSPLEGTVLTSP